MGIRNMALFHASLGLLMIFLFVSVGVGGMDGSVFFGIVVPYLAIVFFIAGFLYRVLQWGRSPVPFHIPTVCGQQKSLPWIKGDPLDSPHTTAGVVRRLAFEVLFFRSLLKNETVELKEAYRLFYKPSIYLWLGAMAFHWSFLVILLRHLRFFLEPVPSLVLGIQGIDTMLQGLIPVLYITDMVLGVALLFLFLRRAIDRQIRSLSLPSDYFAILLILGIASSGLLMRLSYRVDLVKVKAWIMGMLSFHPTVPEGVNLVFYVHLFLVCLLAAYFPVSKMMHMAGVFLSPTRNLKNNSRNHRHINPWNAPVRVHPYEAYEDEFREVMKEVGLPVEKE